MAQLLLSRYVQEGGFFSFYHDNRGDVGALLHANSKRSSMQWCHPGSPKPKKAKAMFSAGKVMATTFWDSGVLYVDFLTEHHTINAEYYSAISTAQ
jgi:hypothetical protein